MAKLDVLTRAAALNSLRMGLGRDSEGSSLTEMKKMEDIVDARIDRQVDTVDALAEMIKNSTTPEQLVLANNSVDAIGTTIIENPEAYLKNQNNKILLQNKAADSINFMGQMEIANNTLNGTTKNILVESVYGDDKNIRNIIKDVQGNITSKGILNFEDEDWSKLTIDDIVNEKRKINNFLDSMYEDPMERKNPHKFINSYNPPGAMNGIALINGMQDYEESLDAAISAMEENKIIDAWEAPWVRLGDKTKIDSIREDRIEEAKSSMIAIRRSVNAIRNHQKKLTNAVASKEIRGNQKFSFGAMDDSAIMGLKIGDVVNNPELYGDMDDETYLEEKGASVLDLTVDQIVAMYSAEIERYQTLFALEHEKYYKFAGQEFVQGTGVIDRIKKKKEKEELEKALAKNIYPYVAK